MKPWERAAKEQEAIKPALKPWEKARGGVSDPSMGKGSQTTDMGVPDPEIAAYTAEVLSGDPDKARRAIVRGEHERMSGPRAAAVAADDIVRLTADGLTFGLADTVGGKLSELTGIGPSRVERRQNTQDARSRAGLPGMIAEAAGGAKTLLALPGTAPSASARTTFQKLLAGGAEGAAMAAASEAGHGRSIDPTDLTIGAVTGAGAQGVASAVSGAGNAIGQGYKRLMGQAPKVPSVKEMEALGRQAYQAADDAGVMLSRNGLQDLQGKTVADLTEFGFHPKNHPAAQVALSELNRLARGHATLKGFEAARKIAIRGYKPGDKEGNAALNIVVRNIDDHVAALKDTPGYVIMGNGKQGADALEQARQIWARKSKAEAIDYAIEKGSRSASTTASGGNTENRVRQEINKLINSPAKSRGWTPDERALAEEVARGTTLNNALRQIGRLSPQGNGVGMMFGLGGLASAEPTMLAGTLAGTIAKPISTAMTKARARKLSAMMRSGGTEASLYGAPNALQRLSKSKRDALARLLMTGALPPAQAVANNQ